MIGAEFEVSTWVVGVEHVETTHEDVVGKLCRRLLIPIAVETKLAKKLSSLLVDMIIII